MGRARQTFADSGQNSQTFLLPAPAIHQHLLSDSHPTSPSNTTHSSIFPVSCLPCLHGAQVGGHLAGQQGSKDAETAREGEPAQA